MYEYDNRFGSPFMFWRDYWREFNAIDPQCYQPKKPDHYPVFSLDGELEQMLQSGFVCHAVTVNQGRE